VSLTKGLPVCPLFGVVAGGEASRTCIRVRILGVDGFVHDLGPIKYLW
jgi:hypothetical protein